MADANLPANSPTGKPQIIRHDWGGWISGPCLPGGIEPVAAELVEPGDVLLFEDGTEAEVTDVRPGFYYLPDGRGQGTAIGWRAGTASGLMFRKTGDVINRVLLAALLGVVLTLAFGLGSLMTSIWLAR